MPHIFPRALADTFKQQQPTESVPRLRLNICLRSLSHGSLAMLVSVSVQEESTMLEPYD